VVTARNADGVETVRWVPVVEEIDTESNAAGNEGANPDPFSIDSAERGLVALRINYPFQSPVLSGFRPSPAGRFEPNGAFINSADDASITELNAADAPGARLGLPSVSGGVFTGPYGGDYGLGTQAAFGRPVRPFRRVLTAQAVYRREIFGPPAS
ncbi:MAG: pilus assembly protein, partial [Planctomycetota bacterium]